MCVWIWYIQRRERERERNIAASKPSETSKNIPSFVHEANLFSNAAWKPRFCHMLCITKQQLLAVIYNANLRPRCGLLFSATSCNGAQRGFWIHPLWTSGGADGGLSNTLALFSSKFTFTHFHRTTSKHFFTLGMCLSVFLFSADSDEEGSAISSVRASCYLQCSQQRRIRGRSTWPAEEAFFRRCNSSVRR